MSESSSDEKKIIIDEDWKSQVESEKEAAEAARQSAQKTVTPESAAAETTAQETVAAADSEGSATSSAADNVPLPPADFTTIISMLATQAMMNLGTLPNPLTGKADLNLPQAKHAIDLLEVLQQKTKGNCTPQEEATVEHLLHEMRLAYVQVQTVPAQNAASASEDEKKE